MLKALNLVAIGICLLLLALCLLDWAALHDIWWDYASARVLEDHTSIDPESLPWWTRAEQEWNHVALSLYVRAPSLLVVLVTLVLGFRSLRRRKEAANIVRPSMPTSE